MQLIARAPGPNRKQRQHRIMRRRHGAPVIKRRLDRQRTGCACDVHEDPGQNEYRHHWHGHEGHERVEDQEMDVHEQPDGCPGEEELCRVEVPAFTEGEVVASHYQRCEERIDYPSDVAGGG